MFAAGDGVLWGYIMRCSGAPFPLSRSDRPMHWVRLYLLHDWIGRGLGSHLMGTALRYARLSGGDDCWLRVWMDNHHAIRFYRHWGFEDIGCSTTWLGHELDKPLYLASLWRDRYPDDRAVLEVAVQQRCKHGSQGTER